MLLPFIGAHNERGALLPRLTGDHRGDPKAKEQRKAGRRMERHIGAGGFYGGWGRFYGGEWVGGYACVHHASANSLVDGE